MVDNNKSLLKTQPKSNAELRKMFPKGGEEIGIINGETIGAHDNGKKFTKRSKLSHNK